MEWKPIISKVSIYCLQLEKTQIEVEAEATAREKAELQSVNDLLLMQMEDLRKNLPVCLRHNYNCVMKGFSYRNQTKPLQ